ncbi:hypothetical protein JCM19239_1144 [Vibrio variabilis]|uniref:Uncharacterized protein n=1 Tax=Vibrio variabilis TaxID=990271 RepID=A0ABQ0JEF8_9VIBR|nr:hypothetical protein JCM19239_1144 [Vibrio variabilis]
MFGTEGEPSTLESSLLHPIRIVPLSKGIRTFDSGDSLNIDNF